MLTGAVDRLALLTGRPDVPTYKRARGYTFAADKFGLMKFTQYFGGGSVVQPSSLAGGWGVPQQSLDSISALQQCGGTDRSDGR